MALQDNSLHLIDQFLTNRLTKEEELLFNAQKKEVAFQTVLAEQTEIAAAIKLKNRKDLKNRLQTVEKTIQQQKSTKFRPLKIAKIGQRYRVLAIAASLALLVLAVWWLVPITTPDYYSMYFEPYPNVIAPIQKSEQTATLEQQAYQAYELKDYTQASALFHQLEPTDVHQFYQAMIALETGQLTVAIESLEHLYQQPTARFQQAAGWYLALAYLKNGETAEANLLINEISQTNDHPFQKKAIELKKAL